MRPPPLNVVLPSHGNPKENYQFPIYLPNPGSLFWDFPIVEKKKREGRRIRGCDASGGTVFEWYGESGAQLKYYPLAETATWSSPIFQLEPPPLPPSEYGLLARVKQYFPKQWQATE